VTDWQQIQAFRDNWKPDQEDQEKIADRAFERHLLNAFPDLASEFPTREGQFSLNSFWFRRAMMMATTSWKRRVEALEKAVAGSEEVGLEALVRYSMKPHLYDAETASRIKESRLWLLIQESAARGLEPQGRAMNAQESERPRTSIVDRAP
jgi:hypothetical protein